MGWVAAVVVAVVVREATALTAVTRGIGDEAFAVAVVEGVVPRT